MSSHYPRHIAIILDGNRRWAKKRNLKPWMGHSQGVAKLKQLLKWIKDLDIKEVTLYCFSTENFNRPKREVDYLMKLFRDEIDHIKSYDELDKYQIKVTAIGRLKLFPKDIQKKITELVDKTKNHKKYQVNFAMGYGGRQEIVDAAKSIAKKKGPITEKSFAQHLYLSHDPDIIIRPGGESRISNFLLWQGSYSEWFFIKPLWPEFTKRHLVKIIDEYQQRHRRYGT